VNPVIKQVVRKYLSCSELNKRATFLRAPDGQHLAHLSAVLPAPHALHLEALMTNILPRLAFSLLLLTGLAWSTHVPRFAYTANIDDNTISCYVVDPLRVSAALRANGYALAGKAPRSLTIAQNRFLYAANQDSNDISAYNINSNGTLNRMANVASGAKPHSVLANPAGTFLFVSNSSSNTIRVFAINSTTGALQSVQTVNAGASPRGLAIDPTGRYLYAANLFSNNVSAWVVNPNGLLAPVAGSPFSVGFQPVAVKVDPLRRQLYVASSGDDKLSVLSLDATTGALSLKQSLSAGTKPRDIAVSRSGSFVHVASQSGVHVFSVNSTNGLLSAGSTTAVPSTSLHMAPDDRMLFTTNGDNRELHILYVANGTADARGRVFRSRGKAWSVAVTGGSEVVKYVNKFLYLTSTFETAGIKIYGISETGALAKKSSPDPSQEDPKGPMVADPYGRFLFVGTVGTYKIDGASGALTRVEGTPRDITPLGTDPSGRFLFVRRSSTQLGTYKVASTGVLSFLSSVGTSSAIRDIVVDPLGKYLEVMTETELIAYIIDPVTGSLTRTGSIASSPAPRVLNSDGSFLYILRGFLSSDMDIYHVNPINGQVTFQKSLEESEGYGVAVDPYGVFLFVGHFDSGFKVYRMDQTHSTGDITTTGLSEEPFNQSVAFTIDYEGRFLYAGGEFLETFRLDRNIGDLTIQAGAEIVDGTTDGSRATQIVIVGSIR
jgi:6-phosphogluconolactonase (cycloisomerase 2 family)